MSFREEEKSSAGRIAGETNGLEEFKADVEGMLELLPPLSLEVVALLRMQLQQAFVEAAERANATELRADRQQ